MAFLAAIVTFRRGYQDVMYHGPSFYNEAIFGTSIGLFYEFYIMFSLVFFLFLSLGVLLYLISARRVRSRRIFRLTSSLASIAVMIVLLEFSGFVVSGQGLDSHEVTDQSISYTEDLISRNWSLYVSGEFVYEESAVFDQFRRRTTYEDISASDDNIILFGCSYAYGSGLHTNSTLQSHLRRSTGSDVYNYAIRGGGAHHMLHLLEGGTTKRIREINGSVFSDIDRSADNIGIYYFTPSHVYSALGRPNWNIFTVINEPRYTMVDGDLLADRFFSPLNSTEFFKISNLATFMTGNYMKLWQNSIFLRTFASAHISRPLTSDEEQLFFLMINRSRNLFEEKFGGDFYVLISPLHRDTVLSENIRDLLDSQEIEVLTYDFAGEDRDRYMLQDGIHPNERYNEILADLLSESIQS